MSDRPSNHHWSGLVAGQSQLAELAMRDVMQHASSIESSVPIRPDGQLPFLVRTPPSHRLHLGETAPTMLDFSRFDGLSGTRALVIRIKPSVLSNGAKTVAQASADFSEQANALIQTLSHEHAIDLFLVNTISPEIEGHDSPITMFILTDPSKASQKILHNTVKNELESVMDIDTKKRGRAGI